MIVALAVALVSSTARADPQPWAVGVSDAQKARAQGALDAGNALFLERKYPEALEQYRAAVAAWDHPAIRFNIVRCLIQLDRAVDASDNLKLALAYGAAPLEDAVYQEARSYEKLLANQIAELAISCAQPGVSVTLDGRPLAHCPGTTTVRVTPGPHQLVGIKRGFSTRTLEVVALGGKHQDLRVDLDPMTSAGRIEHRFATWIPWVVFGGGFAIGGIGAILDLSAASDMNRFDSDATRFCQPRACDPTTDTDKIDPGLRDRAVTKSRIAIGIMTVGGAAITTGAVMLILNRGRTVYPGSEAPMVPTITPAAGGATVSWGGRF